MKFKEMVVNFKVVKDMAFISKAFNKDRTGWNFKVSRYLSGAFAYGDRSGHSLDIYDGDKNVGGQSYDTRYDGIKTDDDAWVEFWKKFIEDKYVLELEQQGDLKVDYEEYE
jgi:hypothetical protein